MIVFNSIEDIVLDADTCVTIGNFDGVHMGHQELISKTVKYAKKKRLKSVVFTFSNHPVNFFKPGYVKNIISQEQKQALIEKLGVDVYVNIPFDVSMTQISARDYVKKILVDKLRIKKVIVGHDFSFAKKKEGNPEKLINFGKEYNFEVEIVTPVLLDGRRVSSTDIRTLIGNGDVAGAKKLLGQYYSIEGIVVEGRQIGRTIGFPTANIDYDKSMVIPRMGIYASLATVDGNVYCGATNIGTNPTVHGKKVTIETYILDFDQMIYGKELKVEFVEHIRDEVKFESKEDLMNQLKKDVAYVRENYVSCLKSSMDKMKPSIDKVK